MNFWSRRKLEALRKKVQRLHTAREQQNNADPKQSQMEIAALYELADFYKKHRFDKGLPKAEIYQLECYRAAAALGDRRGQFLCGERILEQARFWDNWSRDPIYGKSIHQKYAKNYFEEAFAYLRAAENAEYPFAKRLLGLAYIHGWGMPKDTNEGFRLVLESIDQEKAWDRATKILDDLKLNSPEFFTALRNYKGANN